MNNQKYIDINDIEVQPKDEDKEKKRLLKAINLIDEFITKFVSKIEYFKMTLESQINIFEMVLLFIFIIKLINHN